MKTTIRNADLQLEAKFNALTLNTAGLSRSTIDLPLEIIYEIAIHLAHLGNRSAVTASLIHPTCTRGALRTFFTNGIVLKIGTKHDCAAYADRFNAHRYPPIHTLRLTATNSTAFYCSSVPTSLLSFWQIENGDSSSGSNLNQDGATMELHGSFDGPESKTLAILLGDIKYLTIVRPTIIYQLASRFETVQELTIVELDYRGFLRSLSRIFRRVEDIYLFYSNKDMNSATSTVVQEMASYYAHRRASSKDVTLQTFSTPPRSKIYFVAVEQANKPVGSDVEYLNQYDNGRIHCLKFYTTDWQEKDLSSLFQLVNTAREQVKSLMKRYSASNHHMIQ